MSLFEISGTQGLITTTRFSGTNTALQLFTIDQFSEFPLDIINVALRFLIARSSSFAVICGRSEGQRIPLLTRRTQCTRLW